MLAFCRIILWAVVDLFRPWAALEAEILVLRQQIIVLRRGKPARLSFSAIDRMVLGLGLSHMSYSPWCARHRSTRHRGAVASRRLSMLLAL